MLFLISNCSFAANTAKEVVNAQSTGNVKMNARKFSYSGMDKNLLSELLIAELALAIQDFEQAHKIYWTLAHKHKQAILAQRSAYVAQYIDKNTMLEAVTFWANLAPNDIEAQKIASGLLLESKEYIRALPYLENLALLQKQSNYMLLVQALLSENPEGLKEVLVSLQKLEKNMDTTPDLATSFAFVYYYLEDLDLAKHYLNKALSLDKDFLSAVLLKAQILAKEKKYRQAEKFLLAAQTRNPDNLRIYLNLIKLQIADNKRQLAESTFDAMLKKAHKDIETSLFLADYLYSLAMYDQANFLALEVLKNNKYRDRANLLLAKIAVAKKQIDLAFKYLDKVKDTSAGFIEANYLGVFYGYSYKDEKYVLKRLRDNRDYAFANFPADLLDFLLTSYKAMQDAQFSNTNLKIWLDEAILLCADNSLDDSELIYARAFYWYRQGNIKDMETDLRSLIDAENADVKYLNSLAYILVDEDKNLSISEKQSRYKEGLDLAQRAFLQDKSLSVLDTLGWALYKNGKYAQAKNMLEQAKQIDTDNDEVNAHLIQVYWSKGETKKSKELVNYMLQLDKKLPYLQKLLKSKPYLQP